MSLRCAGHARRTIAFAVTLVNEDANCSCFSHASSEISTAPSAWIAYESCPATECGHPTKSRSRRGEPACQSTQLGNRPSEQASGRRRIGVDPRFFGAFLNAAGMTWPVVMWMHQWHARLKLSSFLPLVTAMYLDGLLIVPAILASAYGWLSRFGSKGAWKGSDVQLHARPCTRRLSVCGWLTSRIISWRDGAASFRRSQGSFRTLLRSISHKHGSRVGYVPAALHIGFRFVVNPDM